MSATTTLSTAQQPTFSIDHIAGHPGSTCAGLAAILGTVLTTIGQQGVPTSAGGWAGLGAVALMSAGAILGK